MRISKTLVALALTIILMLVAALAFVLGRASQPVTVVPNSPPVSNQAARISKPENAVHSPVPEEKVKAEPKEPEPKIAKPRAEFSSTEQRLIDAYFKGEDMCRGSSDPGAVEVWCPRRDAAFVAMTKAGICYGHDDDQSAADYKIHRCRKGSIK
jgi:hypothetical protein